MTGGSPRRALNVCFGSCKGGAFQWAQGPTRPSLHPKTIEAVMGLTKWLKCVANW
jgi:hypothetical protein